MQNVRTFVLILAAISFVTVIGGAVYEHLAVVPVWTSAVPASLTMMQGKYAITPYRFWIPIHPVTMSLLLIAMILNWRTERRKFVITTIAGYASVLLVTFLYFVPELLTLTGASYSIDVDPALTRRAGIWEILSLIRLGCMVVTAIVILFGLSKSADLTNNLT